MTELNLIFKNKIISASIAFIFQPIGSILSGIVLEPLGRKRSMILVNAPHIIGWLMLYYAKSLEAMYGAAILLGLGVGLMEAPIGNQEDGNIN